MEIKGDIMFWFIKFLKSGVQSEAVSALEYGDYLLGLRSARKLRESCI